MGQDNTEMMAVLRKASMFLMAFNASSMAVEFIFMLAYTFLIRPLIAPFQYASVLDGIIGISGVSYSYYLIRAAWAIDQEVEKLGKMEEENVPAGLKGLCRTEQTSRETIVQGFQRRMIAHTVLVVVEFIFVRSVYTAVMYLLFWLLYQMGKFSQERFRRKLDELVPE